MQLARAGAAGHIRRAAGRGELVTDGGAHDPRHNRPGRRSRQHRSTAYEHHAPDLAVVGLVDPEDPAGPAR